MENKTKKQICNELETVAYISACGGLEIKKIIYGINDYILCVSGTWTSKKAYHKLMIKYNAAGDAYIMLQGYKLLLSDAIRV